MYEIVLTDRAKKELEKLPLNIQERIAGVLDRIKVRPYSFVKHLVGYDFFRLRIGDYRLIVDIKDSELLILVIEIAHRKNVYKNLPR